MLEYDGAAYHGWQSQKSGLPTVEAELTRGVSKVADEPVNLPDVPTPGSTAATRWYILTLGPYVIVVHG